MTTLQELLDKLDTAQRLGDPVSEETRLVVSLPDPKKKGSTIETEISEIRIRRTGAGCRRIVEFLI